MTEPFVTIRRMPYEEPYLLNLQVRASNGAFAGEVEIYEDTEQLRELGRALRRFPARVPDEVVKEIGSDDAKASYCHFRMRAFTIDRTGHCALQFIFDPHQPEPHGGSCRFSIPADPAAVNRLGDLLVRFADLRHRELRWSPRLDDSGLFGYEEP
jgi:hypothetical protein